MATSWNPSDKAAAVTLSGSNQVATGGAGGDAGVRSVHSFTTEKIYFEVQTGSLSDFHLAVGVVAATWNTASGSAAFGVPTDGIGKYATASYIDYNGAQYDNPNVPSYFSSGNRIAFAFDGANARVAVNIFTGGSWSGWRGNGAADPVAGTGMIDVSATLGSAVVKYLAAVLGNGDNGTLRSATAEWTGTCPSGYGEINASVAPADESIWSRENDTDTALWRHLREFVPYYEPYLYANNTQNVLGATTVQPRQGITDDATFDVPWVQWLATGSRLGVAVYQQEWSAAPLSDDLSSTANITGSQTLDPITQSANAGVLASITGAQTLDTFSLSANIGQVPLSITGAQTLDPITLSAAAGVTNRLSAAQTIAAITQSATASALASISGAQSIAAITQSAASKSIVSLSASQTIDAITQSATVTVANTRLVSGAQTIDPITITASAKLIVKLSGSQTLDPFILNALIAPPRTLSGAMLIPDVAFLGRVRGQFWTDEDPSASVWTDRAVSSGVWVDRDPPSGAWS